MNIVCRDFRIFVMKCTLKSLSLPFYGLAKTILFCIVHAPLYLNEHLSSQLPERNKKVHNQESYALCPYFFFFLLTCSAVHSGDWVWQLHSTLLANSTTHSTPFKCPLHFARHFTCVFSYMYWLGTTRYSDSSVVLI